MPELLRWVPWWCWLVLWAVWVGFVVADVALGAQITGGQVTVGTSTPVEVGSRGQRMSICIENTSATNAVVCNGQPGVTATRGKRIAPLGWWCVDRWDPTTRRFAAEDELWCIGSGGSALVTFGETRVQ